jgi:hypothetical protein
MGDVENDAVLFHGVVYLGAGTIDDARDEAAVRSVMTSLGKEECSGINVTLSIPTSASGKLRLLGI